MWRSCGGCFGRAAGCRHAPASDEDWDFKGAARLWGCVLRCKLQQGWRLLPGKQKLTGGAMPGPKTQSHCVAPIAVAALLTAARSSPARAPAAPRPVPHGLRPPQQVHGRCAPAAAAGHPGPRAGGLRVHGCILLAGLRRSPATRVTAPTPCAPPLPIAACVKALENATRIGEHEKAPWSGRSPVTILAAVVALMNEVQKVRPQLDIWAGSPRPGPGPLGLGCWA